MGDKQYKTDFYLDFLEDSMTYKYQVDNFLRCKYTIKSFVMLSFALLILDSILYQVKIFNLAILASLICHAASYHLLSKVHSGIHIRLAMFIPLLLLQLNLIVEYNTVLLLTMLPTLIFDSVTLFSWKYH